MRGTRSIAMVAVVWFAAGLFVSGAQGGETRLGYGVSAAIGHDTNPLRVTDDGPNGNFTQLILDGSVTRIFNPTVALFAHGNVLGRVHGSGLTNGDYGNGLFRAGVGFSPQGLGGIYGMGRSTFVDRETGEEFEVDAATDPDPLATVAVPGRFDVNDYGAFFNARWNQSRVVRLFLDATWRRSDFVNDYSDSTNLAPLDHNSLKLEPGVNLQLGRMFSLGLSVALTDVDYDSRPALDESGSEVADVARSYRYATFRSTLSVTPGPRWNVQFGMRAADRRDVYAGYYNYGARTVFASVQRQLAHRSSLRLFASWNDLQYDNAPVPESSEQFLGSEARSLILRYEHRVGKQLIWFADVGDRSTDSKDSVFAYERNWVLSGIQFRR